MGRRSRNKGKRGEREASAEIARLFGVEARRGVQYQGSAGSPDVVTGIDGVHIEVKRTERLRIHEAIEQALADGSGKLPLVLHRANDRPWLAIVCLDDLPRLAELLYLTMAENA